MNIRRRKSRPKPFKRTRRSSPCDDFDKLEDWMAGGETDKA